MSKEKEAVMHSGGAVCSEVTGDWDWVEVRGEERG